MRHGNYRLFFVGQLVSLVGTWVQLAALIWLAYHLTGTSRWPAIVAAAQMAPAFLLAAWGGVLADRRPRRQLVFQTQTALMVLAFLLAFIVWTGEETVWHLLVFSIAIGVVNAVDLPARLAFLVEMVGKQDLVNAVGLNSLMFNLARASGPALAAWFLKRGGPELCFLINGFSFLAVLIALAKMRIETPPPVPKRSDSWNALCEGFRFVAGHSVLRVLLPLTVAVTLFGWPILALLPALADRHLEAGGSGYGSLLSIVGVGALTAAFLVAAFGSPARRWLFIGFGAGLASLAMVGLSFAATMPLAIACSAFVGAGLIFFFATSQAVFQLSATDENRGRVMGIYSIVLTGAHPLGNLLSGPAADRWGEPVVLRLQGCAILTAGLLALVLCLVRRGNSSDRGSEDETSDAGPVLLPFPTATRRAA
jgi:MFS family permease